MKRFAYIISLILFAVSARGGTLYVKQGHYTSIQSAINNASNGDTIIVDPCTYYENINFLGKAVKLTSLDPNDPCTVASTIIDGSQPADPNKGSVITFSSGEGLNSILTGFTIQNGTGQTDNTVTWRVWTGNNGDGGGVFCRNASPTIAKNIFKNCSANYGGGAIYCHNNASPLIAGNIFNNNYAGWYGGAIFGRINCSPTIINNIFKENECKYLGGAIYLCDNSYSQITRNWFESNNCQAIHGGAIYYFVKSGPFIACNFFKNNTCNGHLNNNPSGAAIFAESNTGTQTNGRIINNLLVGNRCLNTNFGVIGIGSDTSELISNNIIYNNDETGIYIWNGGTPIIKNNNVWQNINGNYGGIISDQNGLNGNISQDPLVGPLLPEPFTWHELEPNSPCINSGDNNSLSGWLTSDYDGTARIVNSIIDMGPQEYYFTAVPKDYDTIQQAINSASNGDEIIVMPGFYQENIDFLNKNIKLRSINPLDSNCIAQTIIDGNNIDSCIKILSSQNETTVVAGFTIQNGHGQFGGGVLVFNSIGPTVMHNHIHSNKAVKPQGQTTGGYGGGIDYRLDSGGTVKNNIIENNYASAAGGGVHLGPRSSCNIINNKIINNSTTGEAGGGIYCYSKTSAWILNNEIADNHVTEGNGGGIWLWDNPAGLVKGNLIIGNIATDTNPPTGLGKGGGIGLMWGDPAIENNLIIGNTAGYGGGIFFQYAGKYKAVNNTIVGNKSKYTGAGISIAYLSTPLLANNIIVNNGHGGGLYVKQSGAQPSEPNLVTNNFWNNEDGNYLGDINDPTGINGNISADPCFVEFGYWSDNNTPTDSNDDFWVMGDYRIGYFSPCRDTGTINYAGNTDFAGNHRPHFTGVDIGAFELQVYDLTATGTVDYTDISLFCNDWLKQNISLPTDLFADGVINFLDFSLIASDWLQ